ncbi:tyrosine-protein phosphatase non-receptor type 22 isoform X1 [Hippoglossus hippoglossus]|uniref:tyrosine-protein phosphatase non-receptor type 22 isoform X1 n=1 Tax=Hippoglossus hippoglossus TaxID=8267 RepID=UPI00148BE785|nr:tyrosine-protein phosphatase non-receptor type 22 isoform X1 [Hippoglossus hippoglossus]
MEQQARVLRTFLAQLERQEAADEDAPNGFAGEFSRLKSQSTKYRTDKTFPTKTADKQENTKKNRYKDIVPFDHSRVKLIFTATKNDTDYINANFIKGVSGSRAYIATQGPLPHTVLDFFRMLWEYNIKVVVMACREFEMGKKKCECYWPQKHEQPFVCEPFTVHCDSEEYKGDYLTRTLRVTFRNCSRTLKQLHYVNWPDHGVPDAIHPILDMLHEMRSYQAHDDVPICIHCSAGCGRTGALCAIDYTWNLLKKQMITADFNIYDLVQDMRTQRPSVVQTKEQYELVYRTIKLLFKGYLHAVDAQKCRNEVTMVACALTPESEKKLPDQELVLLPQPLQNEERDVPPQLHHPSPSTPENLIASTSKEKHMDQQQWSLLRASPDAGVTGQDLQEVPGTSPQQVHTSQSAPAAEERDNLPSLNPPTSPEVAICMMVEDPYFDSPMNSPLSEEAPMDSAEDARPWTVTPVFTPSLSLNDQSLEDDTPASVAEEPHTDEEAPPPLPERTPESYVLAVDAEPSDPCESLSVIIPQNAAAEAVREWQGRSPSPVPPLPERTAESFELDLDQAPVEQNSEVTPAVNLKRIGTSSEWSGDSKSALSETTHEKKPWMRSKSLRAKTTLTAPVTRLSLAPNSTSELHPFFPPLEPLTPPLLPHNENSRTDRTPESFILKTDAAQEKPALWLQPSETAHLSHRVGLSAEWDGNAQPKKFLDVVMSRSKSVRAKSSKQVAAVDQCVCAAEPLDAVWQLAPPPVVVTAAGSVRVEQPDVNRRPSPTAEPSGNQSDRGNEKGMSRTRSLRFFRHKLKPKNAPPPPPNQPGAAPPTSSSAFKFGFGNRFGKPKGPRSHPDSWF